VSLSEKKCNSRAKKSLLSHVYCGGGVSWPIGFPPPPLLKAVPNVATELAPIHRADRSANPPRSDQLLG
jgi:hypothetical protein